ncbi:MAG: hypothetical protein HYY17_04755 [Planctomycetes bacterium]|nr:hypothetical protein [Planctomycetota bacterium]
MNHTNLGLLTLAASGGGEASGVVVLVLFGLLVASSLYASWLLRRRPTRGVQAKIYRFLKKVVARCTGRVDLSDEKVLSFKVELAGAAGIYPGGSVALVATAGLEAGKTEVSQGTGKGRIPWKDLPVAVDGARVNDGVVTLGDDPRTAPKTLAMKVGLAGHPELTNDVTVPVHFAGEYVAHFSGGSGRNGAVGDNGRPGSSGGGEGGRGRDGGDGEDAEDAGDVEVVVTMAVAGPMLQVRVHGTPHEDKFYLIDPNGGSLTVYARGGAGGRGGDGGWGGSGGWGGGDGGDGGDGGNGAGGGNGGRITLVASPETTRYLDLINLDNSGGDGGGIGQGGPGGGGGSTDGPGQTSGRNGNVGRPGQRAGRPGRPGPKPETRIEPVPPLW